MSPDAAEAVRRRVDEVVHRIAEAHWVDVNMRWLQSYAPEVNQPERSEEAYSAFAERFGPDAVHTGITTTGARTPPLTRTKCQAYSSWRGGRNAARGIDCPITVRALTPTSQRWRTGSACSLRFSRITGCW